MTYKVKSLTVLAKLFININQDLGSFAKFTATKKVDL